jgi:UDP-N-acetylmuramate dehydrogenase
VFTNPPGDHAARLIDAAGGKGLRVGGASVSEKHANFIVAAPGARASDVVGLIEELRALVADRAGIRLEPEVRLIGSFA